MKSIHKFKLPEHGHLMAPLGKVVLVAYEGDNSELPTVWIERDMNSKHVPYSIVGTGEEYNPLGSEHVGSAICGRFVWHVFRNVR